MPQRLVSLMQHWLFISLSLYCGVLILQTGVYAAVAPAARSKPVVIQGIPYPGAAKGDRRRSLDLYLPADSGKKPPPLLIFVHGGFWLLTDDDYRIGPKVADALVREGVAVALIRYRIATLAPHPGQAEDVAAGVSLLVHEARRYGYDPGRIFLAGHSAGGHLASLVALDPSYLEKYRVSSKSLAGVISFSGLYDLTPKWTVSENQRSATEKAFGKDPGVLKQASPITHTRADAPPFLLLTAQSDFPGFSQDAKQFTDALNKAGHRAAERWIVEGHDHFSLLNLTDRLNEARLLLLDFLRVAPPPREYAMFVDAKRRWRNPIHSTLPFWRQEKLVRTYEVDRRFVNRLVVIYANLRHELQEWPLQTFHAIDLFEFIDALPPEKVGRGGYLVTTNIRNEKQFWKREHIEAYKPVIVIGLDEEKNLFRLGVFYRALREYSWKSGPQPPMMARPLGAFIHFLKEPPPEMTLQAAQFALTEDSFRLAATDPLAGIGDLSQDLYEAVTARNGCVYCHSLRGLGSRSHHVVAATGVAHGGEALALESYPPGVWRKFIFDQLNVAKTIGASPNVVSEEVRQPLFELVNRSRKLLGEKK
jgi:arylformamidase